MRVSASVWRTNARGDARLLRLSKVEVAAKFKLLLFRLTVVA
jgi:hypothetical protein